MNEWQCTCGETNTGNFCKNCGKSRPQPAQTFSQPATSKNFLSKIKSTHLAIIAGGLLVIVVGIYAYYSGIEERYLAKCAEANQIVSQVEPLLSDIDTLQGDPAYDDAQNYIERLTAEVTTLENLMNDLKNIKVNSEYREQNKLLVNSLETEISILNSAKNVVEEPQGVDTQDQISEIELNTSTLAETLSNIHIPSTDFAKYLNTENVANSLRGYIARKEQIDAERRAEEERRAREAEMARLAAIQDRLQSRINSIVSSTSDIVWVTTDVTRSSDYQLRLSGFFYNGTTHPVTQMNDMKLSLKLYDHGNVVLQSDDITFGTLWVNENSSWLYPRQRYYTTLNVNFTGVVASVFDEFYVNMDNAHWTYINN